MSETVIGSNSLPNNQLELGKTSACDASYNPHRLYAISRSIKRQELGIEENHLPFYGFDCWNHYEVSWLNQKGKPIVALAEIVYACDSPFLIESKSLKLYFNSFNNTSWASFNEVKNIIETDLSQKIQAKVLVNLLPLRTPNHLLLTPHFTGLCIDDLDITCTEYLVNPAYLSVGHEMVEETVYSDLLKSNCLVTNQPDWGSVQITYSGRKIQHEGLLKYLISFRNHNEFHEQCIERIFSDLMRLCQPKSLTVYGRYTRRGGLDINPYRSTEKTVFTNQNIRLMRQ